MKKCFNRGLAILIAASMSVASVPVYASEPVVETETVVDGDLTTNITTTTTTSEDENGNTVVKVEIKEVTEGIDTNGDKVNKTETITTTKTENENESSEKTEVEGSETREYMEDVLPGQDVPDLEMNLIPGQTSTDKEVTDPVVDGDLPEGENDPEYNYTITTTEREAQATLTENKDKVVINTDLECPVGPEEYEGKENNYYDGSADDCKTGGGCGNVSGSHQHYREGLSSSNYNDLEDWGYVDPKPDTDGLESGYDFVWSGYGDGTKQAAAVYVENLVYLTDENGEIVVENGFPVVDMEKSTFVTGKNNKSKEGMVGSAGQFALKAQNGEYFYAYCMDADTGASPNINRWYQIRNLEDAIESESNPDGYITEEEAAMIRAIATVGYWGTNANVYETEEDGSLKLDEDGNPIVVKDENGNIVTDSSVRGSVASLKAMLYEAYGDADDEYMINVRYPGSNTPVSFNICELIEGLTEAEALAVTQAAIWTFANNGDIDYNGKDTNATVVGVLSANSTHNGIYMSSFLNEFRPAKDGESDARMQALYQCLLGLTPIYPDDAADDTNVIPNENVFENIVFVVEDKVEDHEDNQDDNADNDVYNTELNFTLAFIPDPATDDLLIYLTDAEGNVINDKDGKPIVRRLAGTNTEGRTADTIIADENGVYTLTGLQLGENKDFVFDLRIEGTQYLNEGVYIYQAHGGREASQTLVGLATGELDVDVAMGMTLNFNVDDKNHVVAESKWHDVEEEEEETGEENKVPEETEETEETEEIPEETEEIPEETEEVPEETEEVSEETEEVFGNENKTPGDNTIEIEDEDVPLADAPETGDIAVMLLAVAAVSGTGFFAVKGKKREDEE